jgi:hypothetical protein
VEVASAVVIADCRRRCGTGSLSANVQFGAVTDDCTVDAELRRCSLDAEVAVDEVSEDQVGLDAVAERPWVSPVRSG